MGRLMDSVFLPKQKPSEWKGDEHLGKRRKGRKAVKITGLIQTAAKICDLREKMKEIAKSFQIKL